MSEMKHTPPERRITEAEAYAFARAAVGCDPALTTAILSGITAGHADRAARINDLRVWADQALMAATMLLTAKVQTPALKKHLEFCISEYYRSQGGGAGAATDWLASKLTPGT